jgi:restriction system protein
MSVPDFQTIMLPLLSLLGDGAEHSVQDDVENLADHFKLSDQDLNELLSSGKQTTFYNRVGWARTYLAKSSLIEMTRRSYYRITQRGQEVLALRPDKIDMKFLERFPEYKEFRDRKSKESHEPTQIQNQLSNRTPEETLEDAYLEIRDNLAQEVIEQVKSCSPAFFERLVVELLVKMGYGGSRRDAARAVGQSGDGGIDGIIDEDRLGLDAIYIQAKRWESVVGRPEIQKFVGALMGRRARKGIFITTSFFSNEALTYVAGIDFKVVLIDGNRVAELMIDYGIGVSEVTSYSIKRIDSDYFSNS